MDAQIFAHAAHQAIGHRRRYTGEPYIQHLANVAALVGDDPLAIQAAWLHDVLEDTQVQIDDLILFFGPILTRIVIELTDTPPAPNLNRQMRKAADRARLAEASSTAQTVKLADMIDNIPSIAIHDPEFARVYLAEKEALLPCLRRGHPTLQDRAHETLRKYSASI